MKKKPLKKMSLNRDTLCHLDPVEQVKYAQGAASDISHCPSNCTTCFYETCGRTCLCQG